MNIAKDTAVTLRYKISDTTGKLLDQSEEPVAYLHGGYGNIFPKVEAELEGQVLGYKKVIELAPEDAFGLRDETLLQTIAKSQFPPGVKVGGQLEGRGADGQPHVYTVLKIKGDQVFLDGNHAFAGKTLRFALEVIDVRPASAEEVAHGHVHGAHGHHH
jgi:FKBP-type peptidyl-prolyl cis-trans isomerase SlyD